MSGSVNKHLTRTCSADMVVQVRIHPISAKKLNVSVVVVKVPPPVVPLCVGGKMSQPWVAYGRYGRYWYRYYSTHEQGRSLMFCTGTVNTTGTY